MTPDVNVLVAAFRADHAHHATAYGCLNEARQNCAQGERNIDTAADGRNRLPTTGD